MYVEVIARLKLVCLLTAACFWLPRPSFAHPADRLNCAKMSGPEFVEEMMQQKIRFSADMKGKSAVTAQQLTLDHDFYMRGLILWPELTAEQLPYYRLFMDCGAVGQKIIEAIKVRKLNRESIKDWRTCTDILYNDEKPLFIKELNKCFEKFQTK